MAVVAAILMREDLLNRAGCRLLLLTDPARISGESYVIPTRTPSLASVVRGRRGWMVSVSGGVDLDTSNVLDQSRTDPQLQKTRKEAFENSQSWWWD